MYMFFLLKACPKCQGDLAQDQDTAAPGWTCQQCGRIYYVPWESCRKQVREALVQALAAGAG